ncbi:phosphopantetheine-binding protein [Rhodanobacter sp. T12-5]|uniref:phosphopantetheine-binding protein n=1 Tax=Rhodanobacter sp. T12-5 TaxID=2024611 RepID=UPI001F5BF2DC|nr:phosphopantetheine-binding protein [Rhodanobacter sp. T12-5]HTH66930.1 phosphopantetheine-binding protein [Rhodanobacter sp.]
MNTPDTAVGREALEHEIARLIIDTLNLEHLTPTDIPAEQPLFGDGLGLDSVDALELALALQKQYGIRIESDVKDARRHFATIATLAAFVESQRAACAD